jgi:hypothetical protein
MGRSRFPADGNALVRGAQVSSENINDRWHGEPRRARRSTTVSTIRRNAISVRCCATFRCAARACAAACIAKAPPDKAKGAIRET